MYVRNRCQEQAACGHGYSQEPPCDLVSEGIMQPVAGGRQGASRRRYMIKEVPNQHLPTDV